MFLKQLYYLREIDRFRSFSKAAVACNVSQPSLSRAIRVMEEELGVVIVDRKQKVFGLTPEGTQILKWGHEILHGVAEIQNVVSLSHQKLAGVIKIGVIPTAVHIIPLLMDAVKEHIGDFICDVLVLANAEIIEKLNIKQLDIGIMYCDECPKASVFAMYELYKEKQVLAGTAAYDFPAGDDVSWETAGQFPLALLSRSMRCRQFIDVGFQTAGVKPIVRLETTSLELIHAAIMKGTHTTILPISSFPLRVPPRGRLQIRRLSGFSAGSIGLVRLYESPLASFVAEVWKIIIKIDFEEQLDDLCRQESW
ncbi:LysR family transcriptional regulator [Komagataeibacter medellinensis]|uniref:Transcriptional regulator LysR family n=1 Tax=Komagataeibacter medellinensis (strain NBRC 3288 / BCRC 11682 / LMG 1693 / Kondo 51) TaxID=634177 RepID=G2I2D3_KOMMN|nr:LysR family transcriptional regulator [Komagataeibacter medellinensis]BAK82549.1 transcriptional regulator LysR family [Komagataeibacter medellinensis NBRC 3288]